MVRRSAARGPGYFFIASNILAGSSRIRSGIAPEGRHCILWSCKMEFSGSTAAEKAQRHTGRAAAERNSLTIFST